MFLNWPTSRALTHRDLMSNISRTDFCSRHIVIWSEINRLTIRKHSTHRLNHLQHQRRCTRRTGEEFYRRVERWINSLQSDSLSISVGQVREVKTIISHFISVWLILMTVDNPRQVYMMTVKFTVAFCIWTVAVSNSVNKQKHFRAHSHLNTTVQFQIRNFSWTTWIGNNYCPVSVFIYRSKSNKQRFCNLCSLMWTIYWFAIQK